MQTTLRPRPVRLARRRVAVAALVLTTPALTACGLGFNAQTDKVYQPAVGTNNRSGEVAVLGALVVSAQPGSGVFIASLVNNSTTTADQLTGIQGAGVQVATGVHPAIPVGGLVNLASGTIGGVSVRGRTVKAGGYVTVRLTFANADPVTVEVPVVTNTGPYAGLAGPANPPNAVSSKGAVGAFKTPSASTSPSASASTSPTTSPSASPTG
ncbi:MAG: hypothetical protein ABI873_13430 [Marmoricola sp.]